MHISYTKLSDIQYARFHILPVDLHFETVLVSWYPHHGILLSITSKLDSFKATFSVYKLIQKNSQMTTLYTNWSLYITFTMIYYIRQE